MDFVSPSPRPQVSERGLAIATVETWDPSWEKKNEGRAMVRIRALGCHAVYGYSVLNLPVAGPLIGTNVIFFAVGVYLSLPSQAGEDLLLMA